MTPHVAAFLSAGLAWASYCPRGTHTTPTITPDSLSRTHSSHAHSARQRAGSRLNHPRHPCPIDARLHSRSGRPLCPPHTITTRHNHARSRSHARSRACNRAWSCAYTPGLGSARVLAPDRVRAGARSGRVPARARNRAWSFARA